MSSKEKLFEIRGQVMFGNHSIQISTEATAHGYPGGGGVVFSKDRGQLESRSVNVSVKLSSLSSPCPPLAI